MIADLTETKINDENFAYFLRQTKIPYVTDEDGFIHVKGNLHFGAKNEDICVSKLKTVSGEICTRRFTEQFSAPNLLSCEGLDFLAVKALGVRKLKICEGDISMPSIAMACFPSLQKVHDISISSATTFSAEMLEEANNIHLRNVADLLPLSFSKLKKSGTINAPNAKSLLIPVLEEAEHIIAENIVSFYAPALERSGSIRVNKAEVFFAPVLKTTQLATPHKTLAMTSDPKKPTAWLNAKNAKTFYAPELGEAELVILSDKLANTKQGPLLFSDEMEHLFAGIHHIYFFNEKTKQVKIGYNAFMDLEEAKKTVCKPNIEVKREKFFKKCEVLIA